MTIRKITTPAVPEPPGGIYSQCLVVGERVFISGQTAGGPDGKAIGGADMTAQARVCFARVRHLIEAAGASMSDVVKLVIYVTDISKRAEVSIARKEMFSGDFPCSTLVEIRSLVTPDLMIEIDAEAIIGASKR